MWSRPRVTRTRNGDFEIRLPREERAVLARLPEELREELRNPADPALRRLFPPAHPDDETLESSYRELVGQELLEGRIQAADVMDATVRAGRLREEEVLAWLSAVNDLRLILGTRLGVTEESQDEDLPDHDPRARAYALYHYLGFLEEQIVAALSDALPGSD